MWHLSSGTCVAACFYGGQEFERAVRRLCWLPLDCGKDAGSYGSPDTCSSGEGEGIPCSKSARCGAPNALLLVAGDDGGMQLWQVPLPLLSEPSSPACGSPAAASAAAPGNGAHSPAVCRLVASFAATHRRQDCVTSLCVDIGPSSRPGQLWLGDSSGHVALWDLSAVLAAASCQDGAFCGASNGATPGPPQDACLADSMDSAQHRHAVPAVPPVPVAAAATDAVAAAVPQRLLLWRAAGSSIVGLDLLEGAGHSLLLVGGQDAAIAIWTRQVWCGWTRCALAIEQRRSLHRPRRSARVAGQHCKLSLTLPTPGHPLPG